MLVLLFVLSGFFFPFAAHADGFRNPFQNAAAIAQGNEFAAQADDASAVFYNPAGMTQLHGVQFLGGFEFLNVHTHFDNQAGQTTHNDLGGQLFLTATPKDLGVPWLGNLATANIREHGNRSHKWSDVNRELISPQRRRGH